MRESQPQPKSIRIVGRARIFFFAIPILVTLIILGIGQAISRDIADDNAMRMSRQYAVEAAANFQIFMNPHMRIMQQMTYSTAIARWLANEHDMEAKTAAFEAMMGHAVTLPYSYYLFTIEDSMHGYVFDTRLTLDEFVTRGELDRYDIESQWYFDAKYADTPFVLNIQRSQPDEHGNWALYIWANHRIYYDGRFVGVFTLGSPFAAIFDATFGGFDDSYKRGYLIDSYGMVRLDSTGIIETTVEGLPVFPQVPETEGNLDLTYEIASHLEELQSGLFPLGTPSREAIRLAVGDYRYAGISPIVGTDWSVLVLSGTEAAFDMRYMPLMVAAAILVVLLLLIGGLLIQRTIFQPLQLATEKEKSAIQAQQLAIQTQQLMYDSVSIPSTLWDIDGNLIDCNEAMSDFLGLPSKQETIERYYEFTPEYQVCGNRTEDICHEELEGIFATGQDVRKRWLHKIGEEIVPVEITMTRIPAGDTFVCVCYAVDLRPIEAAMAKEREAFEQVQLMLDYAPIGMTLFDKNLNGIISSRTAQTMYGVFSALSSGEMTSTMPSTQPDGTDSMAMFHEGAQTALRTGYFRAEFMCQKQDGTPMPTEIIFAKVNYKGDDVIVEYAVDLTERKAIEKREREAYELSRLYLDSAPILIELWDENINMIDSNRQVLELFGMASKEEYMRLFPTLSPEYQPCGTRSMDKSNALIAKAFEEGFARSEWVHTMLDGQPLYVDSHFVRINRQGENIVVVFSHDLTQLKKLEAQLREEEMREAHRWNQALVNSAPYIISVWDESKLVMASDAAIERFGIADAQVFIDRFNEFSPEFQPCGTASSEKALSYIQQAHEEGFVRFEWMHQNSAGEPLPCEIIGKSIKFNGKDVALLYNRDLREIKAAEENERKLKEELLYRERLLTAGNHIAKALLTAESTAALMNGIGVVGELIQLDRIGIWHYEKRGEEFYFVKQHEWLSEIGKQKKRYAEGFAFPYNGSPEFFDILLDGRAINGPTSEQIPAIQAHFNEYGVVSVAILPMFLDGALWGFLSLQDCVNSRTYAKDEMNIMASVGLMFASTFNRFELQEEQRRIEIAEESNRAKSAFLARMSHEIRTPITAVMGISEIELQDPNILPQTEDSLTKIHNSANSLLGIVNDILDLSKIEVGKMEFAHDEYDVASLIVDTASIHIGFASSKNIKYHVNVDENLPTRLIGDALRIGQIINNILSNAFKYTIEGAVDLSFACVQDDDRGDFIKLQIAVKDTGLGMTSEQLADLDNEYTRYHERNHRFIEGTGLGMPIVYSLARLMDSEIKISSEVGAGTTVVVCIPQQIAGENVLGKEVAQNLEQFKEAAATKRFTFTPELMPYGSVLVVDDVEANLYVAKGLLAFYDLKIETCNNGFDVIEKIKQGKVYDIVFMDYMMPGLNGTETMRQMRDMGYTRPIVALTANAMIGMAEEFVKDGFDSFVSKPIQTKQLNAVLTKYIRDRQSPEVIEAAKSLSRPEGDISNYQNDPALLAKLMADFSRSHKNTFADLCHAIETGDINTAHRLAHTIKGSAGLIRKGTLVRVANDIEVLLARKENPTSIQLSAFEQALNAVLDDIGEAETTPLYEEDSLEREDALALLDEVGSLLASHNLECMGFVGELRKIPNTTELCREIEGFNFREASEILKKLKAELEVQ